VTIDFASQAELIKALLDGAFETPLWSTFLQRLRRSTGADCVTLIFRPPGRPLGEAVHLYSGDVAPVVIDEAYRQYLSKLDILSDFNMQVDRAYAFNDLYPPREPKHRAFYENIVVPNGITVARLMRVMEPTGVSAWLVVSRRQVEFDPNVSSMLESIAPFLRGALRHYVAMEQERFTATVTGEAMRLLHFGWMALDAEGHVVQTEPEADKVLTRSGVLRVASNGRLSARPAELERDIFSAISSLTSNPLGHPRAFTLKRDPWLDMLLVPAGQKRLSAHPRAAVIAYVHGDSWRTIDRCEQLAQLFRLSPGEARLALALSRGLTLPEAAHKLELKVGTVRKYSKSIYAKLGARGLPDLIRIVLSSVLSLAPSR
jgi:DNA-binding CsgD family transcriptional regulator